MEYDSPMTEASKDLVSYSLRNDTIFKYVFRHEQSERIFRALLNRLFTIQLAEGEPFEELKRTLSISIMNHVLFDCENELHNIYRYANIKSGEELTDIKEIHFIELPKFDRDKPRQCMTKFEKWLHVLKWGEQYADNPDTLPDALKSEEEIMMAIKRMHDASRDEMVREMMEHRQKALHDEAARLCHAKKEGLAEGRAQGLEQGLKKGLVQGMEKKALEIAEKMKQAGLDIETIAGTTGLCREAIEKL